MKRFCHQIARLALIAAVLATAVMTGASGASAHGFHGTSISSAYNNRIIDDSIFADNTTMSAGQIQNFLEDKVVGSCASSTCLYEYVVPNANGRLASQYIYDVAQAWHMNPRVILATLQKEQSLITDNTPIASQYNFAMGYGCDEGPGCSDYAGFKNQVFYGTKFLRNIMLYHCDGNPRGYSPIDKYRVGRTTTVDGKSTKMGTCATGTMYRYTPHRPDSAYLTATNGSHYYGNYNFIKNFTAWFGPTWGSPWDHSVTGQGVNGAPGGSLSFRPGQTATFYLDLRNTGVNTWKNDGPNAVLLGTDRPRDRSSRFSATWLSNNRTGTFQNQAVGVGGDSDIHSIQTGETARFQFTVTAPTQAGTYKEYVRPVANSLAWFPRDLGIYWRITVQPDIFTFQYLAQSGAASTDPNRPSTFSLTVKNTGNVNWSKTGSNRLLLGTDRDPNHNGYLYDSSWLSRSRVGSFAGKAQLDGGGQPVRDGDGNVVYNAASTSIAPGEAAHFVFTGRTPNRPFWHREYLRPLVEGRAWLNDAGIYWPVRIAENGYQAEYAGQSAYPTIDKSANPVGSGHIDFRNTGVFRWYADDTLQLATARPKDRSSVFATFGLTGGSSPALPVNTENWLSTNRLGYFTGKVSGGSLDTGATVIQPGEVARFMFPLDARDVSVGVHKEYFQLAARKWYWLPDWGVYLNVNVTD